MKVDFDILNAAVKHASGADVRAIMDEHQVGMIEAQKIVRVTTLQARLNHMRNRTGPFFDATDADIIDELIDMMLSAVTVTP